MRRWILTTMWAGAMVFGAATLFQPAEAQTSTDRIVCCAAINSICCGNRCWTDGYRCGTYNDD